MALSSQDKRNAAAKNAISSVRQSASDKSRSRVIHHTDLLSEGPIQGLVDGPSSVYFDGMPLMDGGYTAQNKSGNSSFSTNISLENGSKQATLSTTSEIDLDLIDQLNYTRPVNVIAGQGTFSVTATNTTLGQFDALNLSKVGNWNNSVISKFTDDIIHSATFYSSQIPGPQAYSFVDGTNAFKKVRTGTKVQYKHLGGVNNIAGLTHNAYYYAYRRGVNIWLFTSRAAAMKTSQPGQKVGSDWAGRVNFTTNPNNDDSLHSLSWEGSNVNTSNKNIVARLKGNAATGYEDVEGRIYSVSGTNATWIPDSPTGLKGQCPSPGSYTLEVDEPIKLSVKDNVVLNAGVLVGGLALAGESRQTYTKRQGRNYTSYLGCPEHMSVGFDTYRPKLPFPTNVVSSTFNSNGNAIAVQDQLNYNTSADKRGYTFIGYFKVPKSGRYEWKVNCTNWSYIWIGNHAAENTSSFRLKDKHAGRTNPNTKKGRSGIKYGTHEFITKATYFKEGTYVPIRVCVIGGVAYKLQWRRTGTSFSTDLSQDYYYPTGRNWVHFNNVRLVDNWPYSDGTFGFDIGEAFSESEQQSEVLEGADTAFPHLTNSNIKSASVEFRTGHRLQKLMPGNIAAALSVQPEPSEELKQHVDWVVEDDDEPEHAGVQDTVIQASSSTGLGLTAEQIKELDMVRITFDYPQGIVKRKRSDGEKSIAYAKYEVFLQLKNPGELSFETELFTLASMLSHSGTDENSLTFAHDIQINKFQPFDDFKIIIRRMTTDDGNGYTGASNTVIGSENKDYMHTIPAQIGMCTSFIYEKLTFPFAAIAKTTFNTKSFQAMPLVTYHLRGLKVKVPHNYITREESPVGIANYNRTSSGNDAQTYVHWDGSFRNELVYTNNPAWIFYDIMTNNRYGLGDFIDASDLDKYALYKIARYCDELVDDGIGGKEPRFTCNLYVTKPVDCYKLLKDMATIFRGLLYWHNSKVTPVIDMEKDPIYNFSKANVVGGNFKYETTGSKTRSNQVVVTWNNPQNSYKLEALLVEDRPNIIKTGKVLTEKAVAFGCTSEAQARRYGYWKLWTAANQTRIVSFESSVEGNFLAPGDIINISDDIDAVNRKRLAGRVSSTNTEGTASTTTVLLDADVFLDPANTYKLSVLLPTGGALLAGTNNSQNYIQITDNVGGTTTYYPGDYIRNAWFLSNSVYVYGQIDTEEKAANAKASSTATQSLVLSWSEHSIVETRDIQLPNGHNAETGLSVINVTSAFSEQTTTDSVWVIEEINADGEETTNSGKLYKILSLSQGQNGGVAITAVEHYNEKFDSIENTGNFLSPLEANIEGFEGPRLATGIGSLQVVETETSEGRLQVNRPPQPPQRIKDLFFKIT